MADNDINEVEKEVAHSHAEGASESRSMNLVDLMSSPQGTDNSRTTSGGTLSRAENSLPSLSIGNGQITIDGSFNLRIGIGRQGEDPASRARGAVNGEDLGGKVKDQLRSLQDQITTTPGDAARRLADHTGGQNLDRAVEAKMASREVSKAVSQMPEKYQDAFSKLQNEKTGNYSSEQLSFLKQFAGKDAYHAASRYNDAMDAMRGGKDDYKVKEAEGGKTSDGKKVEGKDQFNGKELTDKERTAKELAKELTGKEGKDQFNGKELTDKERTAAKELAKELAEKVKVGEGKEGPREAKTDKRIDFVNKVVAKLPADLQKEFKHIPMVKDGVGYSQQHVAFLQNHVGKEAAQALNSYMDERRQMLGRKK